MVKPQVRHSIASTLDYFARDPSLTDGERHGVWLGRGLELSGLKAGSTVHPEDLECYLNGFSPSGERLFVHKKENRRCAWDCVVTADKSVSVAALCSNEALAVQAAFIGIRPTRASRSSRAISQSPSRSHTISRPKALSSKASIAATQESSPARLRILSFSIGCCPAYRAPKFVFGCARRKPHECCQFIILSARGEEFLRLRGFSGGADDFVAKPFSMRELIARVRAYCDAAGLLSRTTCSHEAIFNSTTRPEGCAGVCATSSQAIGIPAARMFARAARERLFSAAVELSVFA